MQTSDPATLACYTRPGVMTSAGRFTALLEGLPRDVPALAAVGQGLLIHEHMARGYGSRCRGRPVQRAYARDSRPLDVGRPPEARLPGNCRHFTVLMTAMLRAHGTPARARCGFGGYFGSGTFEDHWVCEYWDAGEQRWRLVDAQIDAVQLGWFEIDFDLTDVPRDQFLIGGDAWERYRSGAADPGKFGLSLIGETGDWWIAANLMRDAAALLNMELLPWDCWGAMPGPEDPIDRSWPPCSTGWRPSPRPRTPPSQTCASCATMTGCESRRRSATPSAAAWRESRSRPGPRRGCRRRGRVPGGPRPASTRRPRPPAWPGRRSWPARRSCRGHA